MLLDSVAGLHALQERFGAFLTSSDQEAWFPADTRGDPAPYEEFLGGLRVLKDDGVNTLSLTDDRWLVLSAQPKQLAAFCETLGIEQDGSHRHWYSSPVALIIAADDWRADSERQQMLRDRSRSP